MKVLELLFSIYIIIIIFMKIFIFFRCRKRKPVCPGSGCNCRFFCNKHLPSPLEADIVHIQEILDAIEAHTAKGKSHG